MSQRKYSIVCPVGLQAFGEDGHPKYNENHYS